MRRSAAIDGATKVAAQAEALIVLGRDAQARAGRAIEANLGVFRERVEHRDAERRVERKPLGRAIAHIEREVEQWRPGELLVDVHEQAIAPVLADRVVGDRAKQAVSGDPREGLPERLLVERFAEEPLEALRHLVGVDLVADADDAQRTRGPADRLCAGPHAPSPTGSTSRRRPRTSGARLPRWRPGSRCRRSPRTSESRASRSAPTAGCTSTSAVAAMARLLSDIATSSVCPSMPKSDIICSRVCGVLPTLTAMTTSAPCARATSTGTLFRIPPSASSRPSMTTGANAVGSDIVARIAREKRSAAQHHRLALFHVGGHAAKRRRQLVKRRHRVVREGDALEQESHLLAAVETWRQLEAALETELDPHRIRATVLATPQVALLVRHLAEEHQVPVRRARDVRISAGDMPEA